MVTELERLRRKVAELKAVEASQRDFAKFNRERKDLKREVRKLRSPRFQTFKRVSKTGLTAGGKALFKGSKVVFKGLKRIGDNVNRLDRLEEARQRKVKTRKRKIVKKRVTKRKSTTKRKRK